MFCAGCLPAANQKASVASAAVGAADPVASAAAIVAQAAAGAADSVASAAACRVDDPASATALCCHGELQMG